MLFQHQRRDLLVSYKDQHSNELLQRKQLFAVDCFTGCDFVAKYVNESRLEVLHVRDASAKHDKPV